MDTLLSSPNAVRNNLFPSPTSSESTSSSSTGTSSHLCTPDNGTHTLPSGNLSNLAKDDLFLPASISTASAAFASFTASGGDADDASSWIFASHPPTERPKSASACDASSLAAALDFPSAMSNSMGCNNGMTSSAVSLGKRLGHTRNGSDGRRHSLQPLMPTQMQSSASNLAGDNGAFTLTTRGGGADGSNRKASEDIPLLGSSPGFLLSPPRLTVSLSPNVGHRASGGQQAQRQSQQLDYSSLNGTPSQDDGKRRRMSFQPDQASAHSNGPVESGELTLEQLLQQTPPNQNIWKQMQQRQLMNSVEAASGGSSCSSRGAGTYSELSGHRENSINDTPSTTIMSSGGVSFGLQRSFNNTSIDGGNGTLGDRLKKSGKNRSVGSSANGDVAEDGDDDNEDSAAKAARTANRRLSFSGALNSGLLSGFNAGELLMVARSASDGDILKPSSQPQLHIQPEPHKQDSKQNQQQKDSPRSGSPFITIVPRPPTTTISIPTSVSASANVSKAEEVEKSAKAPTNTAADVWPDDVEVAFWEALRMIPKLGRRKVLVHGKPCGRNELIADYIERKTGKSRTRKQVSSHIQVLKNVKKDDPEFQQLIAEPKTEEDFYIPAGGMMYAQMLASYGYGGLTGLTAYDGIASGGLLSPYSPHDVNGSGNLPGISTPVSATGSMTNAFGNLELLPPFDKGTKQTPCSILPASFSIWVHCSDSEDKHVYSSLDTNGATSGNNNTTITSRMPMDAIRLGHIRYPKLAEMYQRLPCQFLYIHVPLSVPRADVFLPQFDQFSTQLSLTSLQEYRLTSVTTVYSHGKRVLSLVEPLEAPRRIAGLKNNGGSSSASSNNTGTSGGDDAKRHNFCHQAPFATDFWADFLSRSHPVNVYNKRNPSPSFGKEPSERAALGMAVAGVTIIQEFVIASEDKARSSREAVFHGEDDQHVSPGSAVGDVVLVIAWDLECVESLGTKAGTPQVSILMGSARPSPTASVCSLSPSPFAATKALPFEASSERANNVRRDNDATAAAAAQSIAMKLNVPQVVYTESSPRSDEASRLLRTSSTNSSSLLQNVTTQGALASSTGMMATNSAPGNLHLLAANAMPAQQQQYHQQQQQLHRSKQLGVEAHAHLYSPAPLGIQGLETKSAAEVGMPTLLRKRGMSINKPNLVVTIPPTPLHLQQGRHQDIDLTGHASASLGPSTGSTDFSVGAWGMMQQRAMRTPITPFPQVVQTPLEPPPMPVEEDAKAQRERLARAWAAQGFDLTSPVVFDFAVQAHGAQQHPQQPTNSQGQAYTSYPLTASQSMPTFQSSGMDAGLPTSNSLQLNLSGGGGDGMMQTQSGQFMGQIGEAPSDEYIERLLATFSYSGNLPQ
ncbi:hypothetical protein K437DRAFT_253927 [Tilletiaria anomala UBC 951]|uniref:TEA domain-containing protein n=1 Tax=Tilletiaria anomala (strain ATCC 24038 / CBS 436.72 / UBC 951) TaxID=1037660 RepID=A0A066WG12_TILAU|nr:uncharacterized protein K437DRAFT_253927 [Tilletiaria anomala UBC 951]KDN52731.1 hypothetical protein K437DRAFT_253927 [Tilletiaria anomala UBC 951]